MDSGTGFPGDCQDQIGFQIRSVCFIFRDTVGFFGISYMQGTPVYMCIDRNGRYIHYAAGTKDSHRNFAAIGY